MKLKIRKLKFNNPPIEVYLNWGSNIPEKIVGVDIIGNTTNRIEFARYFYWHKNKINKILFRDFNHNWTWSLTFKKCITEKETKKIIRKEYKKAVKQQLNKVIEL